MSLLIAVIALATPAHAQERTACAASFSSRLATVRAAIEAHAEAHQGDGVEFVQVPNVANQACEAEDALHRISLVIHADDAVVGRTEILCYGSSRPSCTSVREHLEALRRRRAASLDR